MHSKKIVVFRASPIEEKRVALTPLVAQKLKNIGWNVWIQAGAGLEAGCSDQDYARAGANLSSDLKVLAHNAHLVLCVTPPSVEQISALPQTCALLGLLGSEQAPEYIKTRPAYSLERLPRTSGAQIMDVLTSQSSLYGYWAVLDGARRLPCVMPMMTTPSGRLNPANVLILGAGVAGLQAIATAKRLGAVVSAFDVRESARGAVESLDAQFYRVSEEDLLARGFSQGGENKLENSGTFSQEVSQNAVSFGSNHALPPAGLDLKNSVASKAGETAGGYAQSVNAHMLLAQQELIGTLLPKMNLVIATAMVPGKEPPVLITQSMVQKMSFGSVIMDLTTDRCGAPLGSSGNCAISRRGETQTLYGVTIVGTSYGLSAMALDASRMYANNLFAFLKYADASGHTSGGNLSAEQPSGGVLNNNLDWVAPLIL